ncbi:carboxylating nicotinate-nucleotide diphosphorylase [Microbacterium sp. P06]|uniref:carboxylating nicotinate-nucleotide diphosphorylase n=1 Tax=Microbacterium sp. P06 TaxID=3366949 RepID=UPI0037455EA7
MLTPSIIDRVVIAALEEDAPWGDLTSESLIPATATARAELVAREAGVFSGGDVFAAAFRLTDPRITVELLVDDGDGFASGAVLARVSGPARGILTAERIGLNFTQRMSGIATITASYVAEVAHTGARIVDTRKTTPGLRAFERHAVRSGGGHNHRHSLSDAVMAKDNHLAVLAAGGVSVTAALQGAIARLPHTTHIEVEVDRVDQIEPVLAAGIGTIMLDNFSLDDLRRGVAQIAGRVTVEASGGVNLDTVRAIAETGVDVISVGALTHSARALDLGLDITIDAAPVIAAR